MDPREELTALRRLAELEAKAGGSAAVPSPQAEPVTAKDRALALVAGANRAGVVGLPGLPISMATGLYNFAKGRLGALTSSKASPPKWAAPIPQAAMPGTSEWIDKQYRDAGLSGIYDVPRPEDPASRYLASVGAGALAGVAGPQAGLREAAGNIAGTILPSIAGQAAVESAPNSPVAPLAAMLLTQGAQAGASPALKYLLRGSEQNIPAIRANREAFNAVGASPTVGQSLQGTPRGIAAQGIENLLSQTPGAVTVFQNKAQALTDALRRRIEGVTAPSQSSPQVAGKALQTGVENFRNNMWGVHGALDERYLAQMPENVKFPIPETRAAINRLLNPTPESQAVSEAVRSPYIQSTADTIAAAANENRPIGAGTYLNPNTPIQSLPSPPVWNATPGIPYRPLRRLREDVGNVAFNNTSMTPTRDVQAAKALYGAMTEDMRGAVQQTGTDALRKFELANQYLKQGLDRIRETLDPVIAQSGAPEKAFYALESSVLGKKPVLTTFNEVKDSIPKAARESFAAAVVDRLGTANFGQQNAANTEFSATTFLTNYAKLSPEARDAVFSGFHGADKLRAAADDVAKVAANIRQGSKVFANPSGTAANLAAREMIAGLGGGALTAVATGHPLVGAALAAIPAVNLGLAKAMTSKWLPGYFEKSSAIMPALQRRNLLQLGLLNRMNNQAPGLLSQ